MGSTHGRPTVPAAAATATAATNPSQIPVRRRFFPSVGVPESLDDEKIAPARVKSVPHEGHVSADE
jgi:hypothetical protein